MSLRGRRVKVGGGGGGRSAKKASQSRKQKRKNQLIARPGVEHSHWFIIPLLLTTPTMQFSLDSN